MQKVHPKSKDAPDEKTMEVNSSRVKGARAPRQGTTCAAMAMHVFRNPISMTGPQSVP